jgi:hypothetical protein
MSYQGKEVLRIWDFVGEFENWKKENIYSLPLIGTLAEYPVFGYFIGLLERIEASTFGKTVKCFLQALHGINRAFNSYTYSDLITAANKQLTALNFTKNELSLFNRCHQVDSYLDQDFFNLQIKEEKISIPSFIIPDFLEQWIIDAKNAVIAALNSVNKLIDSAQSKLQEFKDWIKEGIELAADKLAEYLHLKKFITSLNNKKKTIEEVLLKWNNQKISIRDIPDLIIPEQLKSKSGIILVPSIAGTLTTIGGLATFFLSLMGLGATAGIGIILKHFITSIVTNFFTSSGAIVSRYMTAAILTFNEGMLPAIFQKTGMAGTAWCFLMQYALPVLAVSVIIITLIKSKPIIGNHLYIYGDGDKQITILGDLNKDNPLSHLEVNETLTEKQLSKLSQKSYQKYYGFSVDYNNEVVYCVNLNTDELLLNSTKDLYEDLFPVPSLP